MLRFSWHSRLKCHKLIFWSKNIVFGQHFFGTPASKMHFFLIFGEYEYFDRTFYRILVDWGLRTEDWGLRIEDRWSRTEDWGLGTEDWRQPFHFLWMASLFETTKILINWKTRFVDLCNLCHPGDILGKALIGPSFPSVWSNQFQSFQSLNPNIGPIKSWCYT